jgi:hypothetical protein
MLALPDDWRRFTGGAVAVRLLAQVPEQPLQSEFARHLIKASLELMLAARGRKTDPALRVESEGDFIWRVGRLLYAWFPAVDDDALEACIRLATETLSLLVVVPPKHDFLLKRALDGVLGGRSPTVFSLDSFISWRTTFASAHACWSHERTLLDLFARCNQHVVDAGLSRSIVVEIPLISE